jgi:ubiquinone/menaquinone biosynthesis C-methylase UbiE
VTPTIRKWLFETLYRNRYLYRFASTVPFAGQWHIWQRLVLLRIRGMNVLELGCGLGDLQVDLCKASYQSKAVERSPQMVAAARDALRRHRLGDPANIIQGSAQSLPFGDDSFDTVVSTFPSEYIYDPDTIAEVERVLRPGGRFIVVEGANLLPVGFIQPLLVLIQMFVYGPAALFGRRKQNQVEEVDAPRKQTKHEDGTVTEVIPNAWFGRHIPLERSGLQRRSEVVRSRRWEVYITIGEKTPWPASPKES